jgi:ATP-dependent phosphoenolpyruvate carboxykinase
MWQWWNSIVSGDVPLEINPSAEVLSAKISSQNVTYLPNRIIVVDEARFNQLKLEILKVINILKPMTYILDRTIITDNYRGLELRFITDSASHALFVKTEYAGHPELDHLSTMTIYHCSHPALPWRELGYEFSAFTVCHEQSREVLIIGKIAPVEIADVLDYALLRFFPEEGLRI